MQLLTQKFQHIDITGGEVTISRNAVLEWLGFENGEADPFTLETLEKYENQSKLLVKPAGGYCILPIENLSVKEGWMVIHGETFNIGKIIAGQLKQAEYIAFFAITIGEAIEKLSDNLFKESEMLDGYIVNLIGSESAEQLAEYVHKKQLVKSLPSDYSITNRFSPGYCNWDVAEQFKLFKFINPYFQKVTLTDSALMQPVKSVSGLIGIGKNVQMKGYKCQFCSDDKCIYRKKKQPVTS